MPTENIEQSPDAVFEEIMAGGDEDKTEEPTPVADKIKVGESEYTPEELATLIDKGQRASEIERGGREKFDAAAAKEAALEDKLTVFNAYENGTPEQRQYIVKELAKANGVTIAEAKEQIEDFATELLNPADNEVVLERQLKAALKEIATLKNQVTHLDGTVKSVVPTLNEIREFASTEKEARQIQSDISQIKEKTGQIVTPEQIKEWRDNGIADPVKAIGVLLPMLQQATKDGADKARKGSDAPDKLVTQTFDSDDPNMGPDEMLARIRKGEIPSN